MLGIHTLTTQNCNCISRYLYWVYAEFCVSGWILHALRCVACTYEETFGCVNFLPHKNENPIIPNDQLPSQYLWLCPDPGQHALCGKLPSNYFAFVHLCRRIEVNRNKEPNTPKDATSFYLYFLFGCYPIHWFYWFFWLLDFFSQLLTVIISTWIDV